MVGTWKVRWESDLLDQWSFTQHRFYAESIRELSKSKMLWF